MLNFIKNELELLNKDNDELQEAANKCIWELADVFAKQGHSGFSANYVINALFRLVKGKPLTPLTGSEDEWKEPHDSRGTRQNKRCSSVFMKEDGTCEDIEGNHRIRQRRYNLVYKRQIQKESNIPLYAARFG